MLSDDAINIIFFAAWITIGLILWRSKQSGGIILFGGLLGAIALMAPVLFLFGEKVESSNPTLPQPPFEVGLMNAFGEKLQAETPDSNIVFIESVPTTPGVYKLTFRTNLESLHSVANAATDKTANLTNQALTIVWQEKFCSPLLKQLIKDQQNITGVIGDLQNMSGETQRIAICSEG